MMGYGTWSWFGLGGWLIVLGCIALVVAVVLLGVWAFGRAGGSTGPAASPATPAPSAPSDAVEVLRLRFAQGEITADEYRAARQVLEANE